MCPLVVLLMNLFIEKCLLPVPIFQGKQAELWVESIRAIGAGRIAELPPICQMDFVQS